MSTMEGKQAPRKSAPKSTVKKAGELPRRRAKKAKVAKSKTPTAEGDEDDEDMNELDISDDEDLTLPGPSVRRCGVKRKKGRAPRSPVFQPVNLDEAEVGELVGEVVDEENMQMGDLATKRSGEGKVSKRGKDVSIFVREFQKRNKSQLEDEANGRYECRQIVRRQMRAVRNSKRAERRAIVEENDGDPDAEVSDDEADSETDYVIRPERLTPESSPEPGAISEREASEGDEADIEEAEYIEPPEGGAPMEDEDEEDEQEEETASMVEEVTFDADLHAQEPRPEYDDEELDPELAALGFTIGSAGDGAGAGEVELTTEELEEQIRASRKEATRRNEQRVVIEDDETGKMPNNRSYAKKVKNEKWSFEETELFYHIIGQTGENYTLMSFYFPGRNARQLKNKGKKENTINPERVDEAIRARRPIDAFYLQKTIGFDPAGPTQKADELIEVTRDLPARWTREDTDRDKALEAMPGDKEEGAAIEEENFEDLIEELGDDKGEDENMDEEVEEDEEDKDDEEPEEDEEDAGADY